MARESTTLDRKLEHGAHAAGAPTPQGAVEDQAWAFTAALSVGLVGILAVAPWPLGSNRPWASTLLFFATALFLVAAGTALLFGRLRVPPVPLAAASALVLAASVVAWVLVQSGPAPAPHLAHPIWSLVPETLPAVPAIAVDPPAARERLLRLLMPIGLVILGFLLGADRERADRLVSVVLVLSAVQAGFGLLRAAAGWEGIFGAGPGPDRVTGSFVNANHFAAYVNIGAILGLVLLLERVRRSADSQHLGPALARLLSVAIQERPLLSAAFFVCLLAVAASASRGGSLALVVSLLVLLAIGLRGARRPLLWAGVVLLGSATTWAITTGGEILWERLATFDPRSEFSPDFQGRILAFAFTLEQIAARPWLGHGYGGFLSLFNHARDERFAPGLLWDYVHNTYLELAVELGIPATVVLVLAVVLCHLPVIAALRYGTRSPLPLAAIGVTLVQALHALVDFGWQIPAITATWAVLLGAATGRSASSLARVRQGVAHEERTGAGSVAL
ncbi:MAG: O-antigen ligase family protein [Geminicoccaceae bacterium]|nr:O-antigen ligase family protein [Geminicoccaceae bacterium]